MRENSFKDYETIRAAVRSLVEGADGSSVLLLALGDAEESMQVDALPVRSISFESDPATVARYYQAADLYLHAAGADTFPLSILEALACGTPVIATAVGGIPEQVKSLRGDDQAGRWPEHPEQDATGMLVAPGDSASMADAANMLLDNDDLRKQIARNAAQSARSRFDIEHQCDSYLNWYEEILCPS
jgi:glycosyltransferase involved in cell wall biosynthesis